MNRLLAAVLALCVLLIALAFTPKAPEAGADTLWDAANTTYSAGPRGALAIYTLLQEVGLDTDRLSMPGYKRLPHDTILWTLGSANFGRRERDELLTFVQGGGTLVAAPALLASLTDDANLGEASIHDGAHVASASWGCNLRRIDDATAIDLMVAPDDVFARAADGAPVVAVWRVGAGRLVAFGMPTLLTNEGVSKKDAGIFVTRLALSLGPHHIFDEVRQGFGTVELTDLLARLPYRHLLAQFAALVGVALLAASGRRWPVRLSLPPRRRRVTDHIDAVARLWERAGDASLPLHALMTALDVAARHRLGVTTVGFGPFVGWVAARRPDLQARAQTAWEAGVRLCTGPRTFAGSHARTIAVELMSIERETQLWSKNLFNAR